MMSNTYSNSDPITLTQFRVCRQGPQTAWELAASEARDPRLMAPGCGDFDGAVKYHARSK
jgi:hypothetical protein